MKSAILILLVVFLSGRLGQSLKGAAWDELIKNLRSNLYANEEKLQSIARSRKTKNVDDIDVVDAKTKAKVVQRAREDDDKLNEDGGIMSQYSGISGSKRIGGMAFHRDPVLNALRRSGKGNKKSKWMSAYDDTSSSSQELKDWKEEWNEQWIKKKIEALNSSAPKGDFVNMMAARPWGVACGDPRQHDMPWGTCMLAAECDAEYRIYRGDYQCGRTHFVCCSLQLNTYDMYQGFDVSFGDTSLQTDSADEREANKGSKEKRRRRREREKKRRKRQRDIRKRKIKQHIRKIVKEVEKILNRAYRNGTTVRRKKTKTLKKYIKYLKKKYRQDRDTVKDIHEIQLIKIDSDLMKRITEIRDLNNNFMKNDTFREIIMKGVMSASGARMLVEAYPELNSYIGVDGTRRAGGSDAPKDYLNYDIEYGLLYS